MRAVKSLLRERRTVFCLLCCLCKQQPVASFVASSRLFRVTNNNNNSRHNYYSTTKSTAASLEGAIRDAYLAGETDGILELAKTMNLQDLDPDDLIDASVDAAKQNKAMASGIINAWIGACCLVNDDDDEDKLNDGAELAWSLLRSYDEVTESTGLVPDIVTLSLVYSALTTRHPLQSNAQQNFGRADAVLERASRWSKKKGGGKRRKSLAATKRQPQQDACAARNAQDEIQKHWPGFQVLDETPHYVVLSKPSGMVCFHKHKTTSGKLTSSRLKRIKKGGNNNNNNKYIDVSLEDLLLAYNVPLSTLNPEGRGLVHRIDRGTSGCIVLAKTDDMHARLVSEFFLRRVQKRYRAVVWSGQPSLANEKGILDTPVGGHPAKSSYRVLRHLFDQEKTCAATELELSTFTGRKHQVRVHCANELNQPILLDPIYGNDKEWEGLLGKTTHLLPSKKNQRLFFLHASSLIIPAMGINARAPVPEWWEPVLDDLTK